MPSQVSDTAVIGLGNILLIVSVVSAFVMLLLWSIRRMGKHEQAESTPNVSDARVTKALTDLQAVVTAVGRIEAQNEVILRQQTTLKNGLDLTRVLVNMLRADIVQGRNRDENSN